MESLKRPEMIVSVATATGLIGAIIYFYKRENALQEEINKLSDHIATTTRKVGEMQIYGEHIHQLADAINALSATLKKHDQSLNELRESLKTFTKTYDDDFEGHQYAIEVLAKNFTDLGVNVDIERPRPRRSVAAPKPPVNKRPPPVQQNNPAQKSGGRLNKASIEEIEDDDTNDTNGNKLELPSHNPPSQNPKSQKSQKPQILNTQNRAPNQNQNQPKKGSKVTLTPVPQKSGRQRVQLDVNNDTSSYEDSQSKSRNSEISEDVEDSEILEDDETSENNSGNTNSTGGMDDDDDNNKSNNSGDNEDDIDSQIMEIRRQRQLRNAKLGNRKK